MVNLSFFPPFFLYKFINFSNLNPCDINITISEFALTNQIAYPDKNDPILARPFVVPIPVFL